MMGSRNPFEKFFWILKIARKPPTRRFKLMLRITSFAILVLGFYTYVIRLVATLIKRPGTVTVPTPVTLAILLTIALLLSFLALFFLRRRR